MTKLIWASKILAGLSGLLALVMPAGVLPAVAVPYLGLAVAALLYASRWCEQQLPTAQSQAVTGAVAAGVVEVDGAVVTPPQVVVLDAPAGPTVQP